MKIVMLIDMMLLKLLLQWWMAAIWEN